MTKREYRGAHRLAEPEKQSMWQELHAAHREMRTGRDSERSAAHRPTRWRWSPAVGALTVGTAALAVAFLTFWTARESMIPVGRVSAPVRTATDVAVPPPDAAPEPPASVSRIRPKSEGTLNDSMALQENTVYRSLDGVRSGSDRRGRSTDDERRQPPGGKREPGVLTTESAAMAAAPVPAVPAESGGTRNPNDRPYDLVYHEHTGVNPFVAVEDDALSTFAVDVDDASWTITRRYLRDGHLPGGEAVRLEEFVNAFDPGWPSLVDRETDFAIHAGGAPSYFGTGYHLLRIGIQSREIRTESRRPATLIFVIDVSGSMRRENRLGLVKQALHILVDELGEGDRVGIVTYGSEARIELEPVDIEHRADILAAIDGLAIDGSTNAEAGLRLAYDIARRGFDAQAINRLILCSDGVANVGNTGADSILESVRREADRGIMLTTVGFGMGNYNDVLMEKLADQGDGTYHYVDRLEEADRIFRQELTGTLQVLGRDAKVQVEFASGSVTRWRLLGYENRDVADRDFRNDAVDAGEIGGGHTVTALYEIKLTDRARTAWQDGDDEAAGTQLATVRFRWQRPHHHAAAGQTMEISRSVTGADLAPAFSSAAAHLRLAAVVAEFAEILRGSYWARGSELRDLVPLVENLAEELPDDPQVTELRDLVRRAADLDANPRATTQPSATETPQER